MNTELENKAVTDHTQHKPLVSIGMPVYNGAKFIREALDSLLAQTFTDFELIISDNASNDETEAICREYAAKDKRIRYIRQPENRGAVANFLFVLDEAVGEYFMWAAADDIWDSQWIEELLPISESGYCIAFGTLQTIDARGRTIRHPANRRKFSYRGARFIRRTKYFIEPAVLGKANPIYGLYPKSLLKTKARNVLASNKMGADMLFLYNMLELTEIKGKQTVYLYKRIHDECSSISPQGNHSKNNLIFAYVRFCKRLFSDQYRYLIDYSNLSNLAEKLLYVCLFPFALLSSTFVQITTHSRFAKRV